MADSTQAGYLRGAKPTGMSYGPLVVAGTSGGSVATTAAPVVLTTSAPARVASSATVVTLMVANAARLSLTIYNESTQVLYVKTGSAASATDYNFQVPALGYYEMPVTALWRGIVTGIWASAVGAAMVTEGV